MTNVARRQASETEQNVGLITSCPNQTRLPRRQTVQYLLGTPHLLTLASNVAAFRHWQSNQSDRYANLRQRRTEVGDVAYTISSRVYQVLLTWALQYTTAYSCLGFTLYNQFSFPKAS